MGTSNQKVSIVTLGCAKNQADTDNLRKSLHARGYEVVADPAQAGAIVVHTCSFIEAAKKESIDAILEAGRYKTPGKKLIVSGCLVQQHGQQIFDDLPEVDAFLGTGQLGQIADFLDKPRARFLDRANPGGYMDPDSSQPTTSSPPGISSVSAYLRLSEGCSHPCSFCVIPRLRGGVQSRSEEAILAEARASAAQGVEEFSLIAQDSGDWGRDRHLNRLPELLQSLTAIPEIRWLRLMYMHPASFSDALLKVFAENPDKLPYLDMPFQHIDSKMLSDMRRKTDEKGLRDLLSRIQTQAPGLTLRTTFIVGFPGETDAQFERLLNFVKEGHFNYLGAFTYSQEEETPAARREDQIPEDVKKDRLAALTEAYYGVAQTKGLQRVGSTITALLEESDGDEILGRSSCEAPDIDAVIRLPQSAARGGRFVQAKITGYHAYEFTAEPIDPLAAFAV